MAQDRVRAEIKVEDDEIALGLDGRRRALVRRGLAVLGFPAGEGTGDFDDAFRVRLRSWQASNGHKETGYLTAVQADALIAEGRAVEKREQDDAAFARARAVNTSKAYAEYLARFPNGHHAAAARRLFAAASAREAEERVRKAAAAGEQVLGLVADERVLIERGLASWRSGGGPVDGKLDDAFRTALRTWQGRSGYVETGYLTREQSEELIAAGRKADERKRDDEAFGRAKALNTVASYTAYLTEFPNGRHVAEVRRRLSAIRAREERLKQEREAERIRAEKLEQERAPQSAGEERLRLSRLDRMLIQRALNAGGFDAGVVDGVFGRRTRRALGTWQASNGYARTDYLTADQVEKVRAAERRRKEEEARWRQAQAREAEEARRSQAQAREAEEARRRQAEPGRRFRDCEGRWCPELVVVPAGSYMMGSPESEADRDDDEGPRHRVTLAKRFAVGMYEVTRGEFGRFVRETGHSTGNACFMYDRGMFHDGGWEERSGRSWRNPGYGQTDAHPVVCVSWADAQACVRWLSRETGERYRLLSESEWEYVARAGTTGPFHFGSTISTEQANYDGTYTYGSGRKFFGRNREETVPVGSFAANRFGVHDVHGNVWEWAEDCWHASYRGAPTDGSAWTRGGYCERRVLRGGSWLFAPEDVRSADRSRDAAGDRSFVAGFRVARTLD